MTRITVLTGSRPYDDPWHPFPETSAHVARILASLGEITVRGDVDAALGELRDPQARPDLLVVNIGNPGDESPGRRARTGMTGALEAGMPLLALHSSATTFATWPAWSEMLGGRWERGVTFHPPAGACAIRLTPWGEEVTGMLGGFDTVDERYTALRLDPDARATAVHHENGHEYPLAWTLQRGASRVAYDGLGHDELAYRSDGAREFLRGTATWLLGG